MKKLLILLLVLGMASVASALNLTITADLDEPKAYVSGGLDQNLYIALLGDGLFSSVLNVPPAPSMSTWAGTEADMIAFGLGFLVPYGFSGDFYLLATTPATPPEEYVDGIYLTGTGVRSDHAYACWFDQMGGYGVIGTVTLIGLSGSLQVTISPQAAIDAGAQWRVDNGTWRNSGYTEAPLTVGSHTVEYKAISGWLTPPNETVQINEGQTTTTSGTYEMSIAFVDADATGANNGTSWSDAFNYLQDALTVAHNGTEIMVAQGTYKPDLGAVITPGDRTATFGVINGITVNGVIITGGFAGYGEPDPNARDIDLYETILSGDLSGNDSGITNPADLLTDPTRSENSYHVFSANGIDETAVLDGFTITGGNANGDASVADDCGGALFNYNIAAPTIRNCKFVLNAAVKYGGAVYSQTYSDPTLIDCTFTENFANKGGAMMNRSTCNPTLIGCTFEGNLAPSQGGAISNSAADTVLINCIFTGNWAGWGGAIYNNDVEDLKIGNCFFSSNSAVFAGGAILNYACGSASLRILNNSFWGNSAGANGGGAVYNDNSSPTVGNCILWGNTAGIGPQIALVNSANLTCIFSDVQQGQTEIFKDSGSTIDWREGNIDLDPLFADPGGPDNIPGTRDDNLHILGGSPCIDSGSNYMVPQDSADLDGDGDVTELTPFDIDGEPRFVDDPASPNIGLSIPGYYDIMVDMGADEIGPCGSPGRPYLPADVNHDCKIDFLDIAIIGDFWLRRY
jgi:hypothetical protein